MLEVQLSKLHEIIATYLAQREDCGPLILFGRSGMGRTETVAQTLKSIGLRSNEVPDLLGSYSYLLEETDVATVRSYDGRSNLDVSLSIAFMNIYHLPVICTVDETGNAEIISQRLEGKIAPVMCTQSFDEFVQWAESSWRWWKGEHQPRIHPLLLDFLKKYSKYFELDKWHSPRTWEQVSRTWWECSDWSIRLESLMMETCCDEELVSDAEKYFIGHISC